MSDDAIHDILEQTESDPAFQALYDLFDYSKRSLCCLCFLLHGSAAQRDMEALCDRLLCHV